MTAPARQMAVQRTAIAPRKVITVYVQRVSVPVLINRRRWTLRGDDMDCSTARPGHWIALGAIQMVNDLAKTSKDAR